MAAALTAGLLRGLLERYLGTYFRGQIGAVVSNEREFVFGPLELRAEAFEHSDNPIEVKAGSIRSLRVQLPTLTELATASGPVVVHIESALLLLSLPVRRERGAAQEAKEAAAKRARHQAAIAAAEQLLHDLHLDAQPRSTSLKGFGAFLRHDSLSAKTLMRLLANLRLHVHDVRIVLEEDNLLPRSPFAIGLTIDAVSLLPTDDDTEPPAEPSSPVATATGGASSASGASDAEELRKTLTVDRLELSICARESAVPAEFLRVADTSEVFDHVLRPALAASPPLLWCHAFAFRCVMRRGGALQRGGELFLLDIDAPRVVSRDRAEAIALFRRVCPPPSTLHTHTPSHTRSSCSCTRARCA